MADPPSEPGAEKLTLTWVSPAVAVPMVGAPGTQGEVVKLASEPLVVPTLFWVLTRKW